MQVKLNAFRAGHCPGDIVDVSDADGAQLIRHGAAFPVDDVAADDGRQDDGGQIVSGSAALAATSGTDTAAP